MKEADLDYLLHQLISVILRDSNAPSQLAKITNNVTNRLLLNIDSDTLEVCNLEFDVDVNDYCTIDNEVCTYTLAEYPYYLDRSDLYVNIKDDYFDELADKIEKIMYKLSSYVMSCI